MTLPTPPLPTPTPTPPPAGPPAAPPAPPAPTGPERTFTQSEVNAMLAREKDQGSRGASRQLATDLGFTDAEALRAYVEQQRQAEQAALTAQQRRDQELATREAAAAAREAQAAAAIRTATRRGVLAGLGAAGDDLADAEALLGRTLADDADDAAVQAAADALKARRPDMFGGAGRPSTTPPPAPGGAPAGGPPPNPTGQGGAQPGSRGLEMARRRGHLPPPS